MTSLEKLDKKVYEITYIIKENTNLSEIESYELAKKIEVFVDSLLYDVVKDFATEIVKEITGELAEEVVKELKSSGV